MKNRIKNLRKALNLTQQEFADRLNIGRGTLANYEVGRNEPIDAVISLICHEFGVNEGWLRTGEGAMFTKTPNTALEELAVDFYLDSFDEALIQEYLVLSPTQKKMFRTFFYRVLVKSIGDSKPEELLKTEMGYPSPEETEMMLKSLQNELVSQPSTAALDSVVDTKTVTAAPALDADGQKRTEPDLAAKVAALERQNRELAAKVAAMEEEDARMEAADGSSTWEPSSGGTRLA